MSGSQSRRILLADDGPAIRQVVTLTFLDRDYEIVAVDNGDDALAQLHGSAADLVLADIHMPGASGYEVCRQAKQLAQSRPVLLLVGNLEPFSDAAARECGADGMLRKPFDSNELLARVDQLLAEADRTESEAVALQEQETDAMENPKEDVSLSDSDVDRIARRVVELLSADALRDLAWDVVPDMAEVVVRDRLRELESQVEELSS